MAEVIKIGEHNIVLPPRPKRKDDILFVNENGAYWRREEIMKDFPKTFFQYDKYVTELDKPKIKFDEDGKLIALSVEETAKLKRLQEREIHRRIHGVWFRNNDQVLWMPGDYYFNLMWAPMKNLSANGGYGDFRWFQNDYLIFKHYVDNDENSLGFFTTKAKKTGISQVTAGALVNESMLVSGKNFGIMSKSFDDCRDLNMSLIFHIVNKLPDILRPEMRKPNLHNLTWGRSQNFRSLKTRTEPLGTTIFGSKTKPDGFDGPVMYRDWLDEFPKYWSSSNVSPQLTFEKVSETVKLQQQINGKIYITSYPPEDDNKGFYEAKKIYFDSKLKTIGDNPLRRTKSQLYSFFINTLESAEGTFNRFGKTDQRKAFYLNEMERSQLKGDRIKLQAKMRQYPRSEDEAWGDGGYASTYDGVRIGIQKKILEEDDSAGIRPYKEGRLVWANSMWEGGKYDTRKKGEFSNVFFEALSEEEILHGRSGRLRIYQEIPLEMRCRSLFANGGKGNRDSNGFLKPMRDSERVGAVDPTDFVRKSGVEQGSMNASYTGNLYNPAIDTKYGKIASNIILSEYHYRPENPDEFYEDMVKEIIFMDKMVLIEANKKWLVTRLEQDNLQNFILYFDENGNIVPYNTNGQNKLISSTINLINAYVRAVKRYIQEVSKDSGMIDYLSTIKSIPLLTQLGKFRADATKEFDLGVCFGLLRLATESFEAYLSRKDSDKNNVDADALKVAFESLVMGSID